jgi:hypothetical protein
MKYSVVQNFHTENNIDQLEGKGFSTKAEATKYYNSIKEHQQQGGQVETYIFNDDTEEQILSKFNDFDNSENYGKLVIAFQHVGKGMNYAHHFQELFWLEEWNEKSLSDNPDNRFKTWHYILDLKKEDLNGITFEDAADLVKREANLKLENYINFQGLDLELLEENEEN